MNVDKQIFREKRFHNGGDQQWNNDALVNGENTRA